ncbi:helix-turn-helix domain-containing protein [Catenibacterium mitsuokai]|uniref:Helix-turn-helix domain-containing protein n=3 Tax=Catenibacterium TaxID=135858 RepID=A0AAW4N0N5_9FIRM|nr:helix-turn-helix domain-containing protein [Catenibacterium mitsuokai]MBV3371505.1 helix-turn-helix domain-containing protein [Catenibacterium mitsuokai]MBV3376824.1 helix-turn-helix domain-containing protein [Catenibacterium mitsuokai]MBV3379100.1 helix-turn-helix domain-containing protein [Catenibacterium mitsuokai]MBV3381351.1 helix-turn-helix domain-containing protein [Catenibacterium mitsuokai]
MLSNNLKRFRKQKGLTQENVAEALNVVRQTISKW